MRGSYGAVVLALVLAGCAGRPSPGVSAAATGPATVAHPADRSYGTIVAERQVPGRHGNVGAGAAGGVSAGDIRENILTAIDAEAGSQVGGTMPGDATEYIVRVDDGQTISVIQDDALRLLRGARVVIIHGAETHLAPAAQS